MTLQGRAHGGSLAGRGYATLLAFAPYRVGDDLGRNDLQNAAKSIVAGLGMGRWTPHDLRRTAATILNRAGYSLEQIGALLAHARKGV